MEFINVGKGKFLYFPIGIAAHVRGKVDRRLRAEIRAANTAKHHHHGAKDLRQSMDSALYFYRPSTCVIDLSRVEFMDSSGLGLILGRCSVAEGIGASVRVTGASDQLMRLIRLSGLERVRNLSVVK